MSPQTLLLDGAPGDIAGAFEGVVDLLVTGSRSYGPMERALLGSVSETLTEGASYPALVVPRGTEDLPRAPAAAETLEVRR